MKTFDMLWPGGRKKALTFSYDDGVTQDRRLIALMRSNGLKGTFNLNSGFLGWKDDIIRSGKAVDHSHIPANEVKQLYEGFEVAVHTVNHYIVTELSDELLLREILKDRETLESIVGYPVRGMAYPFWGTDDPHVQALVRSCGIRFARGVNDSHALKIPKDPLNWSCTCHHSYLAQMMPKFFEEQDKAVLLAVWGHSYEFDENNNWDEITTQMSELGGREDVWYACNSQVFEYIDAYEALETTLDGCTVRNGSCMDVWIEWNGSPVCVASGQMLQLGNKELDVKQEHPFRIWKG